MHFDFEENELKIAIVKNKKEEKEKRRGKEDIAFFIGSTVRSKMRVLCEAQQALKFLFFGLYYFEKYIFRPFSGKNWNFNRPALKTL